MKEIFPCAIPPLRSVSFEIESVIFAFIFRGISLGDYYDGLWHHVCISWTNKNGFWKLFVEDVIIDSGSQFQTGHVIRGGGVIIIGQHQDVFPGDPNGFQHSRGFVGRISGINLWDFNVPQHELLRMSQTCGVGIGNVLQWLDFENKYHGDVILENPSSCQVPNADDWSEKNSIQPLVLDHGCYPNWFLTF